MPSRLPNGAKKLMEKIKQSFPPDLDYVIALDTTLSVTEGIKEIQHTLFEALVLVMIVVFVFLQGWRATLIPLLAVPVSLVGTFMLFPMFGFSINTLSLFGLVLAIGLVVDDAIVVVEAVEHHIEHGLSPKDATLQSDGRGDRPGDRHRRHPGGGFRADRFHSRHHRSALPAVRGHHRHLGDHLRVQRADPQSRPLRDAAEGRRSRATDRCRNSTTGSTASSAASPAATSASAAFAIRKSALSASSSWLASPVAPASSARSFPPASCPTRTRATSLPAVQLPDALRCSARQKSPPGRRSDHEGAGGSSTRPRSSATAC
jgi:hypothetical protein